MKNQRKGAVAPRLSLLCVALSAALSSGAYAQPVPQLPDVTIQGNRPEHSGSWLNEAQISHRRAYTSDTARLLEDTPGVSLYTAGGVSSLPVINGLADDRLRIKVDGMDLIASCPNHMNSPLSYVDPTQVESVQVYPGVTPVSLGGDSIGGTVVVKSKGPEFAAPGQGLLQKGEVGTSFRSNGNAKNLNLSATIANENLSLSYKASSAESGNYKAAKDFKNYTSGGVKTSGVINPGHTSAADIGSSLPKDEVGSTAYKSRNQLLTLAVKGDRDLVEGSFGYQDIPYELYPNQRMDMLGNTAKRFNLRYEGRKDWGKIEARAYHETVDHHMDFGADKAMYYGTLKAPANTTGAQYDVMGMPMNTSSKTDGLSVKAEFELTPMHVARTGWEVQQYKLNDWWPPAPDCGVGNCWGGMAPYTFLNINNGQRDRQAIFGEVDSRWSDAWFSQLGLRLEQVKASTGNVVGYHDTAAVKAVAPASNMNMYAGSSVGTTGQFNALDKNRSDTNIDWTALSRFTPDDLKSFEFGLAQKTRSPNLYERFAWSTNTMAMEMVNWVGDGNGYVGNPNLKPEVAHTLSVTGDWHSENRESQFVATPFYTHVRDYIDASRSYPNSTVANQTAINKFVQLQYVNQEARLYGLNLAVRTSLGANELGKWSVKGLLNYTNGKNLDTGDYLYNVMPLNARTSLVHRMDGWETAAEVVAVAAKNDTSATRNEIKTPGYSLFNLRSSYTQKQLRFDFGIENVFNKMYYQPLGGAYVAQGYTMGLNSELNGNVAGSSMWGTAVPGMGRSLYVGLNYKF
jgi:iron complex outermembrane receptor protein